MLLAYGLTVVFSFCFCHFVVVVVWRGSLFVVRCSLFVVCCVLFGVCWRLVVSLLFAYCVFVGAVLFVVVCL